MTDLRVSGTSRGATGPTGPTGPGIDSADPVITFRPFNPAGPLPPDVFGDLSADGGWAALYAAVRDAVPRGNVRLVFDTEYCPIGPGVGNNRAFTIPARGNGLAWDMRGVTWDSLAPVNNGTILAFADGCFIEGLELIRGDHLLLVNNSLVSTPFSVGGASPLGGLRSNRILFLGFNLTLFNTVAGAKPVVKLVGPGGAALTASSAIIFHQIPGAIANEQFTGTPNSPSPVVDLGGFNLVMTNVSLENNTFTSLAGAATTGATTSLSADVSPGDTIIPVISTTGFPVSGSIQLNNTLQSEIFVYTSKDATNFFGSTPVQDGYAGPSGAAAGSSVIVPVAVNPGDTTINVLTTTGFAASGAAMFNGGAEIFTYTGLTATSFTGVSPIVGSYPIGTLIEPVRAVATSALPAGTTTIPVNSTAGFPASGTLFLYQNGVSETVSYTGTTQTAFTGVGPTANGYGTGAIMERASSFRGGTLSNQVLRTDALVGRFGSMQWQMPNLDLSTVTVAASPLGSPGTGGRTRSIIRTTAPITPVPTTTTAAVAVGAMTLPVASTAGFPTAGYLVLNNGSESVRYTGVTATSFTGVTALIKAHASGISVVYGATLGETVLVNATAAVTVQLPTAERSFGEEVVVVEASGGAAGITVLAFNGQTINGASSDAIAGARAFRRYTSNGVGGWLRVG